MAPRSKIFAIICLMPAHYLGLPMTKYLSISQKIFILMVALLCMILVVVITMTFTESRSSKQHMEQSYLDMHFAEFMVVKRLHSKNLSVLLEAEIEQSNNSLTKLSEALQSQMSFWQLNELVMQAWIFDARGETVYESSQQRLPFKHYDFTRQSFVKQAPLIWCGQDCLMYVAVPFTDSLGQRYIVYVAKNMTQIMADLNLMTGALISQVSVISDMQLRYRLNHHVETSDNTKKLYTPVTEALAKVKDDTFLQSGLTLNHQGQMYFISFVQLNPTQEHHHQYLVFMQNVQSQVQSRESFATSIVIMALVILTLFSLVFYSFTAKYRKRLTNLVERFPMIKDNQFEAFNSQKLKLHRSFADELDMLDDAAMQLAKELAELHQKMSDNESQLRSLAMYDGLTQLANRNKLNDFLYDSIIRMRQDKKPFGVILVDLDDFKKINDGQGHTVGDQLLQEVAERLRGLVREIDLVCRFGGDEFVIVVEDIAHVRDANIVADKVLALFEEPFAINDLQFFVSVSLGMTVCNSAVLNSDEIIRQADTAMYRAKEVRGNSKRVYDAVLNSEVIRKIELEHEAREALEHEHFYLALQPIIDIRTNDLHGFEALLRWRHPEKGLISPTEFIPILENSTFMFNLDYYVLERSMKALQFLNTLGYKTQTIAINLSAMQFLDRNLAPYLERMFNKYQIKPERLELELTERTLVSDVKSTSKVMRDLRKVGVKISIDDFGTGYSSLSYLSTMPVKKIKIDQSFVNGMLDNKTDEQIVTSTIAMLRNIGMTVVAEGVETLEQYVFLRDLHCDLAQGFLIAKPIPEHQLRMSLDQCILDQKWVPPRIS